MATTRPTAQMPDLSALRIADHKRGGRPVGKWIGIILVLLLIVAAGLWGASFLKNRAPEVEVSPAISPSSAPASVLLNASGYVTPRRRASVAAKITGKIVAVYVDEGVHVTQGQILAQLDDSDYRISMTSTKAERDSTVATIPDLEVQLGNAERELKRTTDLVEASGSNATNVGHRANTGEPAEGANCVRKSSSASCERENRNRPAKY